MAIVDQEGRLFGRINLFDAVVAAVVVAIAALTIVGYRLLRVPDAPRVTTVAPSTLTAGPNLRITINGDNLLPYMKVYLQRTAQPTAVMHDLNPWTHFDGYALVNAARATFLVETPSLAEVRLPDELLPATYDLILYNESKIVAIRQAAFTIVAAPVPKKASADPEATVRVSGAFAGLTREAAASLGAGAKFPRGARDPWGEILTVKPPAPDTARLDFDPARIVVRMRNRWQVPAELRIQCMVTQFKCWLANGVVIAPGANISIDVSGSTMTFAITDVTADPPERTVKATVTIRFVARPDVASLLHEQDGDISPGGDRDDPARIVSIQHRAEVMGEVDGSLTDGSVRAPEKIAVLACVVRVPLTSTETGWQYRSQAIKAGAPITFQTDRYIVRGTIESVVVPGSAKPGATR